MIHSPRVAMYVWEAEANFRQGIDIAVKTDAKSFEPRAVMKAWRVSSREKARDSKRGRSWARSTDGSLRASRARPLVGQWIGTLHGPFEKAQDRIHIERWCRAVSCVVDCVGDHYELLPSIAESIWRAFSVGAIQSCPPDISSTGTLMRLAQGITESKFGPRYIPAAEIVNQSCCASGSRA